MCICITLFYNSLWNFKMPKPDFLPTDALSTPYQRLINAYLFFGESEKIISIST